MPFNNFSNYAGGVGGGGGGGGGGLKMNNFSDKCPAKIY